LKSKMPKRNVYVVKISFTDEAPERNISNAWSLFVTQW
jgi:hypothetical protein